MHLQGLLLGLVLLTATLSLPAEADTPAVRVRAGEHSSYTRLVFDWPRDTGFDLSQNDRRLKLSFDRDASLDLARLRARGWPRIDTVEQFSEEPAALVIALTRSVEAKTMRLGTKIVVDLYDRREPAPRAATPAAGAAAQDDGPPEDPNAPAATAEPLALLPQTDSAPAVSGESAPRPTPQAGPVTITVNPPAPMGLAVYRRNDALWLVADVALTGIPPAIEGPGAGAVGAPVRYKIDQGTVYKVPRPGEGRIKVRRDGLRWTITVGNEDAGKAADLPVRVRRFGPDAPRLLLEALGLGPKIVFFDPDVGDRIVALPRSAAAPEPIAGRRFADFDLLDSSAGIVLKPRRSAVKFAPGEDGITVSAKGGLRLNRALVEAKAPSTEELTGTTVAENRLFAMDVWRGDPRKSFPTKRQEGEARLRGANDNQRVRAYLALARLHLAHGFAHEALSHIGLARKVLPEVASSPEIIAIAGAAKALAGYPQAALKDLDKPSFERVPETRLWQGYAGALNGDWKAAHDGFAAAGGLLDRYPPDLARRLSIEAAEAALRQNDIVAAQSHLERLDRLGAKDRRHRAALAFLRGELMRQTGDEARAMEHWQAASKAGDRFFRVRAELALNELAVAAGDQAPAEAAEELERLRFAWRGDALETAIGQVLGRMYFDAGEAREGFETWRATASRSDADTAKAIASDMRTEYAKIFVGGAGDSLDPIEAYALYQDFAELAPQGEKAVVAAQRLAKRLVGIDLLDRAATTLEAVLPSAGEKAVQIAGRIAAIRLMNDQPDAALATLDDSIQATAGQAGSQERRLLRARAQSELGRHAAALDTLGELSNEAADRLRVDIHWRAEQWEAAAAVLERLIAGAAASKTDAEPALSEGTAKLVLNRAIALTLAGDRPALQDLGRRHAAAMENSAHRDAFRMLTAEGGDALTLSRQRIAESVAKVDLFRDFLNDVAGQAGPA